MGRAVDQDDGIGVYCINLLREMFTIDRHTRYVMLLSTGKHRTLFADMPNVETYVLPAPTKLLWDQWVCPRAARRMSAQIIFNPKFSIPLFTRIPCVFVQQGCDWYVNPENYPWWDNLYIRLMLPWYSRAAARVTAISQATLDDLQKYAHIDVRGTVVTYAGIAPNFTPQGDAAEQARFREEFRLPARYILSVTRAYHIGHAKLPRYPGGNIERLIRAYCRYRAAGGDLPLVVAGHRIEPYLRARGFGDRELRDVHFIGFVPNSRMHMAYQLAECFVVTTLCESFSFPIVEAFACGCPAIVPTTCASPEIAGGAARLVDPRDEASIAAALTEVTGSETIRAELRMKGLARARDFSWRLTAERTLAVLNEIVPAPDQVTPPQAAEVLVSSPLQDTGT
ncbi:MAG: glycosyltransferase family 4 protein [Steroidobacteraceae bacterium]|nr:glycosyltransferase family 4 protein [Steroidobacteraceae bacterium]